MRSRALAAALGCLWLAGCALPPDMTRGSAAGPYEHPLLPPAGTLAVDGPPIADRPAALNRLANSRPASEAVLAEGAALYRVYCAICHGGEGTGDGELARYYRRMPSLTARHVLNYPDGFVYSIIREGGRNMPRFGDALSVNERWALVHYLGTLGSPEPQPEAVSR